MCRACHDLKLLNRPVRTRTPGGVAGVPPKLEAPYADWACPGSLPGRRVAEAGVQCPAQPRGLRANINALLTACPAISGAFKIMATVAQCLQTKSNRIVSVRPSDPVVLALQSMRDQRVRAVLVMDEDRLAGIITQGDCAIKVLLPGRDAKQTLVSEVMTANPMTVKPADPLEACMGLMANRGFRHLPVMDGGRVVGVVSVGDVVKDSIRRMGEQIGFLETYIKGHGA